MALSLALSACGGAGATSASTTTIVDCSWFSSPNCWREALAVADACTDHLAAGRFDSTTTTCTYGDGTTVEFDPSAPATACLYQGVPWDFTVRAPDGAACASFVETTSSWTLMTRRGTATWEFGPTAMAVTCLDGSRFTTDPQSEVACVVAIPGPMIVGDEVIFSLPAPAAIGWLWRCW